MAIFEQDETAAAYEVLAPYYDEFTAGYAYENWVAAIEDRALRLGLRGRRALDLACGTGNSTGPLLSRGYEVLACDLSSAMIDQARHKYPQHVDSFFVADMRELPKVGKFDLVLCLDDAINYLLSAEELEATFACVADALAPSGVFVFDANSLQTYRTTFAQAMVKEREGLLLAWQGESAPGFDRGEIGSASVAIFSERADGLWERRAMRHIQRHHAPETIRSALAHAGLDCLAAGQHPGARLEDAFEDERHIKVVYFSRHLNSVAEQRR